MSRFRRYFVEGGTYFFTLVTARRAPVFLESRARTLLGEAMREAQLQRPFQVVAIVLLPDHLHTIWALPPGDTAYPERLKAMKARFTSKWLNSGGSEKRIGEGYVRQRRRGIWQARYFEHTIRDDDDLRNHADYVHYNPVKHGYARSPKDWKWSSFHRFVTNGDYDRDWGRYDLPQPAFGKLDERWIE